MGTDSLKSYDASESPITIYSPLASLAPKIKAWLTSDTDDVKEAMYDWLDAGKTLQKDEEKFTFGYREIAEEHTLKLEVYDARKKVVTTATKTFSTE